MMSKKTFKENLNPALQFISEPHEGDGEEAKGAAEFSEKAPDGYKVNPFYVEKRSRRLQLLMQPSLYEKLKAKAQVDGSSVNDIIHTILEAAVK